MSSEIYKLKKVIEIKNKVLVVLPTYNGEKFLRKQIKSILSQEDVIVRLVVLDDYSSDNTLDILKEYRTFNVSYDRSETNRGTLRTLLDLIKNIEVGEYLAFADQDDIWASNHLSIALQELRKIDNDSFTMYFPQYRFIDSNDNEIGRRKTRKKLGIANALVENPVIGCGIVLNPTAAYFIKDFGFVGDLHMDHQLYFLACMLGTVSQGKEYTVAYRLHGNNQIGVRNYFGLRGFINLTSQFRVRQHALERLYNKIQNQVEQDKRCSADLHFMALKKGGFYRFRYALSPRFKRESLRDQLTFQVICALGLIY
jgi:rhamnosyltransferase